MFSIILLAIQFGMIAEILGVTPCPDGRVCTTHYRFRNVCQYPQIEGDCQPPCRLEKCTTKTSFNTDCPVYTCFAPPTPPLPPTSALNVWLVGFGAFAVLAASLLLVLVGCFVQRGRGGFRGRGGDGLSGGRILSGPYRNLTTIEENDEEQVVDQANEDDSEAARLIGRCGGGGGAIYRARAQILPVPVMPAGVSDGGDFSPPRASPQALPQQAAFEEFRERNQHRRDRFRTVAFADEVGVDALDNVSLEDDKGQQE